MQCQCLKIPVIAGKTKQLETWIAGLSARDSEVIEALAAEQICDEAVFLSREGDTDFLYLYSRAEDLVAAGQAFEQSTLPVDVEFKRVLAECLAFERAIPLSLVFSADRASRSVTAGQATHPPAAST